MEPIITYNPVYRSLTEPVYLFRFWLLRQTLTDVALALVLLVLTQAGLELLRLSEVTLFGITLDPWAACVVAGGWIIFTSALHEVRPEAELELILRGWLAPKRYAPRLPGSRAGKRISQRTQSLTEKGQAWSEMT